MKSHRMLKQVFRETSVQCVAESINLSPSTVYKWAESPDTGSASGISNPLDRTLALYRATGDLRIVRWLCEQSGGFFVENSEALDNGEQTQRLAPATSQVVKQFADLLSTVAGAASDSKISTREAKNIRKEWESLKRIAEGYVKCCEAGNFKQLNRQIARMQP
jgi:RNA polymerase-binding transcription factor DksA